MDAPVQTQQQTTPLCTYLLWSPCVQPCLSVGGPSPTHSSFAILLKRLRHTLSEIQTQKSGQPFFCSVQRILFGCFLPEHAANFAKAVLIFCIFLKFCALVFISSNITLQFTTSSSKGEGYADTGNDAV